MGHDGRTESWRDMYLRISALQLVLGSCAPFQDACALMWALAMSRGDTSIFTFLLQRLSGVGRHTCFQQEA